MRISELARRTGVPTATIKYYLREGLLPTGRLTSPTQAQYDQRHLSRLRLIRALLGPGRLSIEATRQVLEGIEDPPEDWGEVLDTAHAQMPGATHADQVDLRRAGRLMEQLGWCVAEDSASLRELASSLAAIDMAGLQMTDEDVASYARWCREMAGGEVQILDDVEEDVIVQYAILGTILLEPMIIALRRLALQDASTDRRAADGETDSGCWRGKRLRKMLDEHRDGHQNGGRPAMTDPVPATE